MRAFVIGVAALAFGATLSACSSEKSAALAPVKTDPAAVEKLVADLAAKPFKGKATAAADVAAVRDALPKDVALIWGGLNFDQASGATVLTAVKLTPAQMPTVGLSIDEVRLWDFDADFAKARLAGQRLTETASLASRVEMKGTKVFGIETLMAPTMEAYTDAVADAILSDAPPELAADIEAGMITKLSNYEFSIGRIVINDAMLRPYELKLANLPPEHEFAKAMPMLQPLAAIMRTFAADTVAVFDAKAKLGMEQMGQSILFDMTAETFGMRGMRGGDNDVSFIRNVGFNMTAPTGMSDAASGVATPPMNMVGGIDYITTQDVRFDKLYGYLARGEWPPRTETDLLSYGLITVKNEHIAANGHNIFSVGEVVVDARKWRWFVPTKASFKMNDLVYDIKALMDFSTEVTASVQVPATDPDSLQAPPLDPAIMEALTKYGLDKPSIDLAVGWDWNPDNGATVFDIGLGLDNYITTNLKYEGGFPSFKAVSDLVPDNAELTDGAAIAAVFEKASTLKLVDLDIVDNGGLDKSFGLAAEIMKMQPSSPDAPNPMANMTPEAMRSMATAGVYMLADQAASQVPTAGALIKPIAAFIEKGGRVKISATPKEPVQIATLSNSMASGETTPDAALQQLNVKVEHMPPAGK